MSNLQNPKTARRTKWLFQSLILSVVLNFVLVSIFFYFLVSDNPLHFSYPPITEEKNEAPGCSLASLKKLSSVDFSYLQQLLQDRREIIAGYRMRDFALGALVSFHHFDIDRALQSPPLQRKKWVLGEKVFYLFPGFCDEEFNKIITFSKREKWPYTSQGLFYQIEKRGIEECDAELLVQFCHIPEFIDLETLFARTKLLIKRRDILTMVLEGGWERLEMFHNDQKKRCDFSAERRQNLLFDYIEGGSQQAEALLAQTDPSLAKEVAAKFFQRPGIGELRPKFREDPPASLDPQTHVIQSGESLWMISRRYHVPIEKLMQVNRLQSTIVKAGKMLKIPVRD